MKEAKSQTPRSHVRCFSLISLVVFCLYIAQQEHKMKKLLQLCFEKLVVVIAVLHTGSTG